MKLDPELHQALSEQITLEFSASMVYRQLAIEMDVADLPGIASWFRAQAHEEIVHANKFIDHVCDRNGTPKIGAIEAPQIKANSVLACFQAAYAHEQRVSQAIRELYLLAEKAGDLDSRPILQWFINEQLEEEATVRAIIGRVQLINGDGPGLLRLDEELGQRTSANTRTS